MPNGVNTLGINVLGKALNLQIFQNLSPNRKNTAPVPEL